MSKFFIFHPFPLKFLLQEVLFKKNDMAYYSAPYASIPMGRVFSRISDFFNFGRRDKSVGNKRSTNQGVEMEEIQYPSPLCLSSSYYSVFVVRLAIMVMLAILIGLLTLLTWHFTRVYTTRSLNTLAYELRHELLQRPMLRMWNVLNTTLEVATSQVKLSEYVIRRYKNPVNQAQQAEQLYEAMRDVTWALFASRRALNSITISYKNGFVQAFHRNHKSNNTYYIYSDLANYSISGVYGVNMLSSHQGWNDQSIHNNMSAIWYREPLDPVSGEKIGKPKKIPPDELINIAGISQVPDGTASWHVAVSKHTDSPLLSAALPVWDPSHKSIVAVVGVTNALYSVGQLMKELVEVHSGHIYLTSQEGWLLATSTNTPLSMNSTTGPKLMMAANSADNVIRSGAECLQKTYGSKFPSSQEVHIENARLGNQLYYIDSFFLNLRRLPMVGVIIIPRKYIMGKVDEKAFKTLMILIAASLCIIVVGCICVFILTNGVSKEMKLRAELISHLDARRKAEASSNYKSQFLANMSHELRTPMAAVIGLLDILIGDDCLTNEQYAMITQIRKCSTALLRLLNNILDLSKVESGKVILEETEFDLGRELEGLIDMFSVQCINHNVETVLDLSDDMPKVVRGDSGRIVQIFANLINNSIKFTTSGYVILRGWCENPDIDSNTRMLSTNQMDSWWAQKMKLKRQGWHGKRTSKKDNKIILWFEVDDTGCGIDPSKWESVFESFEQADPSTTRHGGTGLGLCIVRTLVNKMNGEIKVVRKSGPGTLMQLYLILSTPAESTKQQYLSNLEEKNLTVLLALNGRMTRMIMSQWLQKNGLNTYEASDWNELTQNLQELFKVQSLNSLSKPEESILLDSIASDLIIIIDIGLLDLSTDVWKQQLNVLHGYFGRVKFAWILNHEISNTIKTELRSRGHLLMVNRPIYKAKMIQILEAVTQDRSFPLQNNVNGLQTTLVERQLHECLEIDSLCSTSAISDDSDKSEKASSNTISALHGAEKSSEHFSEALSLQRIIRSNGSSSDLTQVNLEGSASDMDGLGQRRTKEQHWTRSCPEDKGGACLHKVVNVQKSLEGLFILLAEDTPVLQRVATIMLEKMGAKVVVVGDGIQAVDSLQYSTHSNEYRKESLLDNGYLRTTQTETLPYDLVLMDCQMPKMDGYEATRAIRKLELGTGLHIPIVALTAHAMSSDEAKCLEVGMDAYLTKPIDCKLMVSTILSLTERIV
ncbi:histidine kinase 1 isoform X3 [Olea europaea var. sylvestris]|uniref:histidine kinase 1 isoform X3 n=1 Tax=Olea europaea var. sylvestris TaxID=158386 RepID=UPI000C1D0647|nr:histidine kinase 1 isoform X3 [Olea europaea var. sylvestris]